jgi:hypothetical protein
MPLDLHILRTAVKAEWRMRDFRCIAPGDLFMRTPGVKGHQQYLCKQRYNDCGGAATMWCNIYSTPPQWVRNYKFNLESLSAGKPIKAEIMVLPDGSLMQGLVGSGACFYQDRFAFFLPHFESQYLLNQAISRGLMMDLDSWHLHLATQKISAQSGHCEAQLLKNKKWTNIMKHCKSINSLNRRQTKDREREMSKLAPSFLSFDLSPLFSPFLLSSLSPFRLKNRF